MKKQEQKQQKQEQFDKQQKLFGELQGAETPNRLQLHTFVEGLYAFDGREETPPSIERPHYRPQQKSGTRGTVAIRYGEEHQDFFRIDTSDTMFRINDEGDVWAWQATHTLPVVFYAHANVSVEVGLAEPASFQVGVALPGTCKSPDGRKEYLRLTGGGMSLAEKDVALPEGVESVPLPGFQDKALPEGAVCADPGACASRIHVHTPRFSQPKFYTARLIDPEGSLRTGFERVCAPVIGAKWHSGFTSPVAALQRMRKEMGFPRLGDQFCREWLQRWEAAKLGGANFRWSTVQDVYYGVVHDYADEIDLGEPNHATDSGTELPYNSCMAGQPLEWFEIYQDLERAGDLRVLEIYADDENMAWGGHLGRALVWIPDNVRFLERRAACVIDRIYAPSGHGRNDALFKALAAWVKENPPEDSIEEVFTCYDEIPNVVKEKTFYIALPQSIDEYDSAPYADTMCVDEDGCCLSPLGPYALDSTDGSNGAAEQYQDYLRNLEEEDDEEA